MCACVFMYLRMSVCEQPRDGEESGELRTRWPEELIALVGEQLAQMGRVLQLAQSRLHMSIVILDTTAGKEVTSNTFRKFES